LKRVSYKKVRKIQPNYFEYTGVHTTDPVEMQLFVYNEEGFEEYHKVSLERIEKEIQDPLQEKDVKWLNVHGLHDVNLIQKTSKFLNLEPYVISDILNVSKRSKIEELDQILFFSVKSILPGEDDQHVHVEQISFVLKDNVLVSFQEKKSAFFTHIRERIKTRSGIVCKKQNDYLLYLLLDAVMENFYISIEYYEGGIENLLLQSKASDDPKVLIEIERYRENLNFLKRSIIPLRDALYTLKSEQDDEAFNVIKSSNYTFFTRLHQKAIEILEQIEYDINTLDSASNFYFSSQSHRMNEIMKVLTVVSVIFMPLTFIVGVYGMNFEYMPELKLTYGYYVVVGLMVVVAAAMAWYFKRKKWF
jgi:magnesium transporter